MSARRLLLLAALLAAGLAPACGGGGGGGPVVLTLQGIEVTTQLPGPLSPFGSTNGGDTVVLTGSAFDALVEVFFGVAEAAVQQVQPGRVIVTTPPGAEGFVIVTVRNPDGTESSLADVFQYVTPPTIQSVVALTGPTQGEARAPIAGGETMEITGAAFKDGLEVTVAGNQVAATFVDPQTATFPVPAVTSEQVVNVAVMNPEGLTATFERGLTYTQEFSLAPESDSLTESHAAHLYRRAGFGAPPRVIQQAVAEGLIATVDRLMRFTNDPTVERQAIALYDAAPPAPNINNRTNQQWWLHLLWKNPNPLQERLAWFLHDHFATSGRGFNTDYTWTLQFQIDLLRRFALAATETLDNGAPGLDFDWRRLLVEVCKDRAMLDWLDGRVSRVGNPNENFPRELWELFMLGEGNGYTEADIKEAARACTGFVWYHTGGRGTDTPLDIAYVPNNHDTTEKEFLGAKGRFGYDSVSPFYLPTGSDTFEPARETDPNDEEGIVSVTLRQRPVEASTFICRKLAEFFLYDGIHSVVVDELAADLRRPGADQWNLRPVLRKILRSKAMYSARAVKGKVKNPVEFSIGFLRTTEIDLAANNVGANTRRLYDRLVAMGQIPLDPPDVNGWPTGTAWLGAQTMVERFNFVNFSVEQLEDVPTQIDPLLPPVGQRDPSDLVDHIAGVLDVKLSGTARSRYIDYVTSALVGDQQVPAPFDPTDPDQLKNKSRGLIWMIAQYHDGHQD